MKKQETFFIFLMAFLMSFTALAIDAMLPALENMRVSLGVLRINDMQLVISSIFLGMSCGILLYGPLSDSWGRKRPLYIGIFFFLTGCLVSIFSKDLTTMLIGRFLQGFGCASNRVVTIAMIRDKFEGNQMGKVMSLIMMIFVIVPAVAPMLGQLVLKASSWHMIFYIFIIFALVAFFFLVFKQEETLDKNKRINFSFKSFIAGTKETLKHPVSRNYTLVSGFVFGAFLTYLNTAPQIFKSLYKVGDKFPFYFGGLALCIGFSSFLNSRFVEKYGMKKISVIALVTLGLISGIHLIVIFFNLDSLITFMLAMGVCFFCIGALFGNLNSLAMEPMGHIAGIANSIISSVQTLISVSISIFVGQLYDGSLVPLFSSFVIMCFISLLIIRFGFKDNS